MARKTVDPGTIAEAIALREAGYTCLAISQRLGISLRTLQRHFSTTGTTKGAVREELLRAARAELLSKVTSEASIKDEAARLVADDLAHARHLREIMVVASEHMKASSLNEVVSVMRAAAAYSTAIKNTSDIIRHSLRRDRRGEAAHDDLPELVVCELSEAEVVEIHDRLNISGENEEFDVVEAPLVAYRWRDFGIGKVLEKMGHSQGGVFTKQDINLKIKVRSAREAVSVVCFY